MIKANFSLISLSFLRHFLTEFRLFGTGSEAAKAKAAAASGGGESKPKKRKMTKGVKDAKEYENKKEDFYDDL